MPGAPRLARGASMGHPYFCSMRDSFMGKKYGCPQLLSLTEESVETVGEEDPGVFGTRGRGGGIAGYDF